MNAQNLELDGLSVRDALPLFYKKYKLDPDGGLDSSSVKITLFKGFHFYIPNFDARKKVVLKHDIHHLITGYSGFMKGETEISAWEISTGCTTNWVAFIINLNAMLLGVSFNINGIWKAWLRGMNTQNLYRSNYSKEEVLEKKIIELKRELGFLTGTSDANLFSASFSFVIMLMMGLILSILMLLTLPFIAVYSLYETLRK